MFMSTLESFPPYSSTGINELLRRVGNALHRVTGRNDRGRGYSETGQVNLMWTLASISSARSSCQAPLVRRKKKGAGQKLDFGPSSGAFASGACTFRELGWFN